MTKKNQHVVPHASGWAVRGAGNLTKMQVQADVDQSDIGRIRERNTYGRDPYPPKG